MTPAELGKFVQARADLLPTKFRINGAPVTGTELGDGTALLPLVAMEATKVYKAITDGSIDFAQLQTESPQTHFTGYSVKSLAKLPDGLIHLIVNSALLNLAREPQPALDLPRNLSEESLPQTSELQAHLTAHKLTLEKNRTIKNSPKIADTSNYEPGQ